MRIKELAKPALLQDIILRILQETEYPITKNSLKKRCKEEGIELTNKALVNTLSNLKNQGYDIKEITSGTTTFYSLIRYGEKEEDIGKRYRTFGSISTPLIFSSDWHIGSRTFSEQAFFKLVESAKKEKVKDIIAPGDLIQGLGVFKKEMGELLVTDIDTQVDLLTDYIRMFPRSVRIHLTIGGHEEILKKKYEVGFDALKAVASRLSNCFYYGSVANFTLNNKWSVLAMHSSGVPTYATSYRLEKIYGNLPSPRPNILALGHTHKLIVLPKPPNVLLIESGALQRETSFVLFRGHVSQVGWVLLKEFGGDVIDTKIYRPRVY